MPACAGVESYIGASNRDGYWWTINGAPTGFDNNDPNDILRFSITFGPVQTTLYHTFLVYYPNIPPGATILSASLSARSSADSVTQLNTTLYGWLNPDPAIPVNEVQCEGAPLTLNSVNWQLNGWTNGFWYTSPDITTVIQEIINQGGFGLASKIILMWRTINGLGPIVNYYPWSFDGSPSSAPILCVDFAFGRDVYFKGMARGKFRKMR